MRPIPTMALLSILGLVGCIPGTDTKFGNTTIYGTVQVSGDLPAAYSFTLYSWSENQGAFDTSWCPDGISGDCYGRVDVGALTTPATTADGAALGVSVTGEDFTITGVPLDLAYILVVTGSDEAILCTTDVLGFEQETKVITSDSAITLFSDSELDSITLPQPARISCLAPATEPEPPAKEDVVEEEPPVDDGGDIPEGEDPVASWTSFTITDKTGSTVYADATQASVAADVSCGADFPSVLEVRATAVNTTAPEAYIRIQFGSGKEASYRTFAAPIVDGVITQDISLTGGYAVVQLDLDETLDGVGESFTVSFCERDEPPAQELLTILTWDMDDTDVDTHVSSAGTEVAYYSLHQEWGDLDIDDVDGFGPETFTSTTATWGNSYDVRIHYYSDHGNGPTTATLRVVYYDDTTGRICDVTASATMSSYEYWYVGTFGPGMICP